MYSGNYADKKALKIANNEVFTKDEIQLVVNSIVHCVSSLQKNSIYHGNIKLSNILTSNETDSVYLTEAGFPS